MQFSVKTAAAESLTTPCLVVGLFEGGKLPTAVQGLDQASHGYLAKIAKGGATEGRVGQSLLLFDVPKANAERVLLVGLGAEKDFTTRNYRKAMVKAVHALNEAGIKEAISSLSLLEIKGVDGYWLARHAVEAAEETSYRFDQFKGAAKEKHKPMLQKLTLLVGRDHAKGAEEGLKVGSAVSAGVSLAKTLGNLPPNVCTPSYLADQAKKLAKGNKLKVTVLDQAQMKKLNMGALLAVARGSRQAPKLIVMEYNGAGKDQKPHVLVGKGITFDTGGISIKPAQSMDEMKFDMCGAASVFGALKAVMTLGLKINVVGVVPSAENMPGGDATRPGDIVTTMSGQTVEILNTDAEGRLILCEALTYSERFKPASIVDIATLTGACVIALGNVVSGLMGNNERLVQGLKQAGEKAEDRCWQLPLYDDYQDSLKSNFADFANIGGREGGAITAACYLSRFTKNMNWAHLDIAGTAWKGGAEKGATGRPVPLLVQHLLDQV
ncbi:MAG TPA: leucyl aminopeptidase [Gammaproteobacteria bacterium]|jgi:leucyl aminopeptidase